MKIEGSIVAMVTPMNEDGSVDYDLIVRRRTEISYDELKAFIDKRDDVLSFKTSPLLNHFK